MITIQDKDDGDDDDDDDGFKNKQTSSKKKLLSNKTNKFLSSFSDEAIDIRFRLVH
jgi:hypothetical protein